MKKTVLFIDSVCPRPYDPTTLGKSGQGGTESTVTKIAEGLAKTKLFDVVVEQHCRQSSAKDGAIYCHSPTDLLGFGSVDYVICLRDPRTVAKARLRFPNAKIYLWSHDLATAALGQHTHLLKDSGCEANLVVSQFHKKQTQDALVAYGYKGNPPLQVIYNPIDDDLKPDGTPYDKNRLCFISSPHKGLDYALDIFSHLKKLNPEFTLHVTNPGYLENKGSEQAGVVLHGSISRLGVNTLLRESLCLFYPNIVFPETFGLVMAEANAVGTPVLTHRMGAASEVCDVPSSEVLDCRDSQAVVNQVMTWYSGGRPTVRGKQPFRLARVLQAWMREILV